MNLFDLRCEVAVVIGGTGVLGGGLAEGLAAAGATVAIVGRNSERGLARVEAIQKAGGRAIFLAADAVKREELKAAHASILTQLGQPTVLVNAAGGNDPKATVTDTQKFEELSLEAWRGNFDLNLVGGVLLPCQEFGPAMGAAGSPLVGS